MRDLDAFYRNVGRFRGMGLTEAQSHAKAEEAMMTMFNILLVRTSAMTIAFQSDTYDEAITKAAETIRTWRYAHDPIQRVFISELDKSIQLQEFRPEEVVELASTRQ